MRNQYKLLLEGYLLILEMDRREFIKKTGQGLAATGIMPGSIGNTLGALGTVGNVTRAVTNYLPDDIVMSLFKANSFQTKGVTKANIISQLTTNKNKLEVLNNFLQNNKGSVGEVYGVQEVINLLSLGINAFSGKWNKEDMEYAAHWDTELQKLTPKHLDWLLSNIIENDDQLFDEVLTTLFEKNAISPTLQKQLEDNFEIWKCDYVNDPASKARRDKIRDDIRKEIEKQNKEEDSVPGSKFDWAGGDWDRHNNYGGPGTYTVDETSNLNDPFIPLNSQILTDALLKYTRFTQKDIPLVLKWFTEEYREELGFSSEPTSETNDEIFDQLAIVYAGENDLVNRYGGYSYGDIDRDGVNGQEISESAIAQQIYDAYMNHLKAKEIYKKGTQATGGDWDIGGLAEKYKQIQEAPTPSIWEDEWNYNTADLLLLPIRKLDRKLMDYVDNMQDLVRWFVKEYCPSVGINVNEYTKPIHINDIIVDLIRNRVERDAAMVYWGGDSSTFRVYQTLVVKDIYDKYKEYRQKIKDIYDQGTQATGGDWDIEGLTESLIAESDRLTKHKYYLNLIGKIEEVLSNHLRGTSSGTDTVKAFYNAIPNFVAWLKDDNNARLIQRVIPIPEEAENNLATLQNWYIDMVYAFMTDLDFFPEDVPVPEKLTASQRNVLIIAVDRAKRKTIKDYNAFLQSEDYRKAQEVYKQGTQATGGDWDIEGLI